MLAVAAWNVEADLVEPNSDSDSITFTSDKNYPIAASFRKKPLQNVERLAELFDGTYARGALAFAPKSTIQASRQRKEKRIVNHIEEELGDSDENDMEMEVMSGDESKSPPRTMKTSSKKRKTNDTTYSQERNERIQKAMYVLNNSIYSGGEIQSKTPLSKYERAMSYLKEIPEYVNKGTTFIVKVMKFLCQDDNLEFFLAFENAFQRKYWIDEELMVESCSSPLLNDSSTPI